MLVVLRLRRLPSTGTTQHRTERTNLGSPLSGRTVDPSDIVVLTKLYTMQQAPAISDHHIGVGFGTAAMRGNCPEIVTMALEAGFRKFDTAEEDDWWYDQKGVGAALEAFFVGEPIDDECNAQECSRTCASEDLRISTKIPPWKLTSASAIRESARQSREEILGFCEDAVLSDEDGIMTETLPFPLDVYYIHAPRCWDGWHPRCKDAGPTLPLREAWKAMEAVVGIDQSARRIGLSNIWPNDLLDIIQFVRERPADSYPPPRMPDVIQAFADPLQPNAELRRVCHEHGIEFVSYSTLGTQHRAAGGNPVLTSTTVKDLATRHDRSVAEVVLSWALQKGMSVIPRSGNRQHIDELSNLLSMPPFLNELDMQAMDAMSLN